MYMEQLDKLIEIAQLDSRELLTHYNFETIAAIHRLSGLLYFDTTIDIGSFEDFANVLTDIRERNIFWSRKLAEAIIISEDENTNDSKETAIRIIAEFIESCPVPYLCEIAESQKSHYL